MNLKPELLTTLTNLGITKEELPILYDRMLSLVSSLQAQINSLDAQIATLTSQKAEAEGKLKAGQIIAMKLLDPVAEPEPSL